jgi:hypothetical protein
MPKPVETRHTGLILQSPVRFAPDDFGYTSLPLFHAYGLYTLVFALHSGIKGSFFSAEAPLTGPALIKSLDATKSKVLYCVPYTLKLISETPGGLERLKGLKQITMGGSSCPEELGDLLVDAGVNIQNHYGR